MLDWLLTHLDMATIAAVVFSAGGLYVTIRGIVRRIDDADTGLKAVARNTRDIAVQTEAIRGLQDVVAQLQQSNETLGRRLGAVSEQGAINTATIAEIDRRVIKLHERLDRRDDTGVMPGRRHHPSLSPQPGETPCPS